MKENRFVNIFSTLELIDTLWNVNKVALIESPAQKYELIDTLWNVNPLSTSLSLLPERELIDTLWNVNDKLRRLLNVD